MSEAMKQEKVALSIRQPWAWLIVNGYKHVENRTWSTRFRGQFLIHAGKTIDPDGFRVAEEFGIILPANLDCGGIVGEAELIVCVSDYDSVWFCGPWGLVIRNARPLPFRPCRGKPGFFDPWH